MSYWTWTVRQSHMYLSSSVSCPYIYWIILCHIQSLASHVHGAAIKRQVQIWPNRSSLGQVEIVSQSGPAMVRSSQVQPCAVRSSQVLTVKYGHGELWPATQCYQGLAVAGNVYSNHDQPGWSSHIQTGPAMASNVELYWACLARSSLVQKWPAIS